MEILEKGPITPDLIKALGDLTGLIYHMEKRAPIPWIKKAATNALDKLENALIEVENLENQKDEMSNETFCK